MLQHKKMGSNISDAYLEEAEDNRKLEGDLDITQVEEKTTEEERSITESEPDLRQPVFKKPKKLLLQLETNTRLQVKR